MELWLIEYQRFDTIVQQIFKYTAGRDYSDGMTRSLQTRLMNAHMHIGAALFMDKGEGDQEKWKDDMYSAVTRIYSIVRWTLASSYASETMI